MLAEESFLTRAELRHELQHFGETVLHDQISSLAARLTKELEEKFKEHPDYVKFPRPKLADVASSVLEKNGERVDKKTEGQKTGHMRIVRANTSRNQEVMAEFHELVDRATQKAEAKQKLEVAQNGSSEGTEDEQQDGSSSAMRRSETKGLYDNFCIAKMESSKNVGKQAEEVERSESAQWGSYRKRAEKMLKSHWFETLVTTVILINSVWIGVVTNYMAVKKIDVLPLAFKCIDSIFFAMFFIEIILRCYVHRLSMFARHTKRQNKAGNSIWWNLLDIFVVCIQFAEVMSWLLDAAHSPVLTLSGARIIRVIRVVRVLKLFRAVRDLRMIIVSIVSTLQLFLWAFIALAALIFVSAVYFTELGLNHHLRHSSNQHLTETDIEWLASVDMAFGDLWKSSQSLFQSISGGQDYKAYGDILERIGNVGLLPFYTFVVFAQLAFLNVITGIFLETAMNKATEEKEMYTVQNARVVFEAADAGRDGTISWDDFESALDHPYMNSFFEAIDLHISEARTLFDLIDVSGDGTISAEEFLNGCLRLRGPAKALDLLVLSREVNALFQKHIRTERQVAANHEVILHNREAIMENQTILKDTLCEILPHEVPTEITEFKTLDDVKEMSSSEAPDSPTDAEKSRSSGDGARAKPVGEAWTQLLPAAASSQ